MDNETINNHDMSLMRDVYITSRPHSYSSAYKVIISTGEFIRVIAERDYTGKKYDNCFYLRVKDPSDRTIYYASDLRKLRDATDEEIALYTLANIGK